jgi:uncharacterized LabA/DUF88 family protein
VLEPRAHLFIDYQNVHLTAYNAFGRLGAQPYESLIDPARLAAAIDAERAVTGRPGTISAISVYRGLPSADKEPGANRRNQAQTAQWTRDRRVSVTPRPLKYPPDWPDSPAREKGIDVRLAVDFTRSALLRLADVLILASRDTDLAPALELAMEIPDGPTVEVCNWAGTGRLRLGSRSRRPDPWCVFLDEAAYRASLDTRVY